MDAEQVNISVENAYSLFKHTAAVYKRGLITDDDFRLDMYQIFGKHFYDILKQHMLCLKF